MTRPKKTRQSEFLKDPTICFLPEFTAIATKRLDSNDVLKLCPAEVYCEFNCKLALGEDNKIKCRECRKEFWLKEVE